MKNIFDLSHAHAMRMTVSDVGASVGPGGWFCCFNFLS